ncbi:hypothetical protein ACOSQ3_016843 [Xanthoceras sorbifolium]
MIGRAKERDGLYYLEESSEQNKSENCFPMSFVSESFKSNKDKIWLHHLRLGHPSFHVLKILFPSLFNKTSVESFHCDVRELAKHKRAVFPISNKRSYVPFTLVHSDVWGLSTVPNISGARWFM